MDRGAFYRSGWAHTPPCSVGWVRHTWDALVSKLMKPPRLVAPPAYAKQWCNCALGSSSTRLYGSTFFGACEELALAWAQGSCIASVHMCVSVCVCVYVYVCCPHRRGLISDDESSDDDQDDNTLPGPKNNDNTAGNNNNDRDAEGEWRCSFWPSAMHCHTCTATHALLHKHCNACHSMHPTLHAPATLIDTGFAGHS